MMKTGPCTGAGRSGPVSGTAPSSLAETMRAGSLTTGSAVSCRRHAVDRPLGQAARDPRPALGAGAPRARPAARPRGRRAPRDDHAHQRLGHGRHDPGRPQHGGVPGGERLRRRADQRHADPRGAVLRLVPAGHQGARAGRPPPGRRAASAAARAVAAAQAGERAVPLHRPAGEHVEPVGRPAARPRAAAADGLPGRHPAGAEHPRRPPAAARHDHRRARADEPRPSRQAAAQGDGQELPPARRARRADRAGPRVLRPDAERAAEARDHPEHRPRRDGPARRPRDAAACWPPAGSSTRRATTC